MLYVYCYYNNILLFLRLSLIFYSSCSGILNMYVHFVFSFIASPLPWTYSWWLEGLLRWSRHWETRQHMLEIEWIYIILSLTLQKVLLTTKCKCGISSSLGRDLNLFYRDFECALSFESQSELWLANSPVRVRTIKVRPPKWTPFEFSLLAHINLLAKCTRCFQH